MGRHVEKNLKKVIDTQKIELYLVADSFDETFSNTAYELIQLPYETYKPM